MDLRAYLQTALDAAYLAKGIHQYYQEKGFTQSSKSTPTDLVTQADHESEAAIRELIAARHPDHVVLGEEQGQDKEGAFRWIVDPLDGTVNYAHGFPFYAVSIGLEAHGEVVLGVVLDTARGELFTATKGGGAYLNGRPIRVSTRSTLVGSLLATGFPYDVSKDTENLTYFQRALTKGLMVRRPGAAALDLAYVAAGRLDGFWEVKLNPWDVAAGWLIVSEAGGRVSGLQGEDYRLGNRYLVASNGLIHQPLLDTLHGR
ncbi:inositol monophosphatase family protein [Meiothermus taiwanensis]|jgi:myo-inositol-1(or 4)-monophosphatase|uniref:Inositol-1-monophosphatase n=2 Tax=Meiothermus taiwanensis TaxID=172827 RepID=A0A399DWS2_9DEIN|nr:inositol monophosphatase family protein [Meiothermus taiwanensis]AWR85347.1 inositol monophosphatase [Meiothermus taiwanensis WR-220]KIQ55814.1 histidinol phosphate phosphatase [Meiothermus taiwanensis]KZK15893.1 inositol monophosphatase [Meiothermus taiwanensis]RIH76635.1 Inositol-1-monophosphatase [Meiothermus taiwanensis]